MRRFNGNVGQVCSLIHKVFHTTHETVRIGTTLYFIVQMNPATGLGIIPFVWICYSTMAHTAKAYKEMDRCMENIES